MGRSVWTAERRRAHGIAVAKRTATARTGKPTQRPVSMADVHYEERVLVRRAAQVFERYGLTPEDEARLYERQHGACALCGESLSRLDPAGRSYHIDHDHETGIVRGLLCGHCNRWAVAALEKFGERGVAYATITPIDLYLQANAEKNLCR